MAYFQPYIDETGYHIPEYEDIRESLLEEYRIIFGNNVYLENDSQDYQMISIFARKMYDDLLISMQAYHAHSPKTSVGVGLDAVVAINGLRRKQESHSIVELILKGDPGTIIPNGIVSDQKGNQFSFAGPITLDDDGCYTLQAKSIRANSMTGLPHTITNILTPTKGWISVTNPSGVISGRLLETDAELRSRQMISVANPSRSILQGTIGAIAAVRAVKRFRVYENDTSITDSYGIPPHSISPVIENGDDAELAATIYLHKTPGCGTFGDTIITVPASITGEQPIDIQFWRPNYLDLSIEITIKKLYGYTSIISDEIKKEIADYINQFEIGSNLPISWLWGISLCKTTAEGSLPYFSITNVKVGVKDRPMNISDVLVQYNEVIRTYPENITIIET